MVLDIAINERYGAPIISSHYDKTVRFWDSRFDAPASSFKMGGKVASLFVSPGYLFFWYKFFDINFCFLDSQSILCSCRDETLSLVDLRTNGILHIYRYF